MRDRGDASVETLEQGAIGTRLGEGLHHGGALKPAAQERTLTAVATFVERAHALDAVISAIATSAMRRAEGTSEFVKRVEAATGCELRILDGDEEAACSFRGATYAAPHDGKRRGVLDVGGGSSEFAAGADGSIEVTRSIEIGSVRLTERFGDLAGGAPGTPARVAAAEARASVAEILAPLREARPITELRCVAGTPLTIGAIAFRSTVNDVSGRELKRAQIDGVITRLLELTLEERKAVPGMIAQRADVLPAGGIIVSEALRLLACDSARLESDDLLLGFLLGPRTA